MSYDSSADTLAHIEMVRLYISVVIGNLKHRASVHDESALIEPEKTFYDVWRPRLSSVPHNSPEYLAYLEKAHEGLQHHYRINDHHPEHYVRYECLACYKQYEAIPQSGRCSECYSSVVTQSVGVNGMSLMAILEMICDWQAGIVRNGSESSLIEELDKACERFRIGDQLKDIIKATIVELSLGGDA